VVREKTLNTSEAITRSSYKKFSPEEYKEHLIRQGLEEEEAEDVVNRVLKR
jgi:hypothetical protein